MNEFNSNHRSQPFPQPRSTPLQQLSRNPVSSLPSLSTLKSAQELSQQLNSALKLQYFRTMEIAYRTSNYEIDTCVRMSGKEEKMDRRKMLNNAHENDKDQIRKNFDHQAGTNQQNSHQQPQAIYMPEAMLIGNITNIERIQIKNSPQLMRAIFKSVYDNSEKHILILCEFYKTNLIRFFNNMMRPENKNNKYAFTHLKPIIYLNNQIPPLTSKLSTSSQFSLPSNNSNLNNTRQSLFFLLQPQTQLINLTQQYYLAQLKPIERILSQDSCFNYSNVKLTKIFTVDQLDFQCKDGFQMRVIKQRFQNREKKDSVTIVGLVTDIERIEQDKNYRHRKQIVLWMVQVLFKYTSVTQHSKSSLQIQQQNSQHLYKPSTPISELGRCRVILRYSSSDQPYIEKLLQINNIYVIADPQLLISDNVNVIYMVNISKNSVKNCCIFKVNQQTIQEISFGQSAFINSNKKRNTFEIKSIQNLFGIKLQTTRVSNFWQKCINRNIVKLELGLLQVELLYGSIRCSQCGYEIKYMPEQQQRIVDQNMKNIDEMERNRENDNQNVDVERDVDVDEDSKMFQCRQKHKQYHGLQLWGTVRAADQSGSCLVSMEHKEIIRFLELEQYYEQIEAYVRKNGRGLAIMSSNKEKLKPNQDPLFPVKNCIRKTYVEKTVICHAKFELDKTFRESLNEQEQLEYQSSFQNTKKYLQSNKKIFPNGIIEGRGQETVLIPFVKALQVNNQQ